MTRGETRALGVALVGHAVLFGLLSVGFLSTSKPLEVKSKPIEVSLADDVALESAAPTPVEPPAKSVAPDTGAPTDAPPPAKQALSDPTPAAPAPEKAPARKPTETPPREKPKPASDKPAKSKTVSHEEASQKAEPKPKPKAKSEGKAATKPEKPRGSHLGSDFLKGIADTDTGKSTTPSADHVDAKALAGIIAAIQRQIQPCANRQVNPGPGADQIETVLNLRLNRNGSLAAKPSVVRQSGIDESNQRYARRVADLAIASFTGCSPLDLPDQYYQTSNGGWSNINFTYKLP